MDTLGFVLAVLVLPANQSDGEGAKKLLEPVYQRFTRMEKLWLDNGYKEGCAEWIEQTTGWEVEIVRHPLDREHGVWVGPGEPVPVAPTGFQVLPKRWVVERTFAWLCRSRRLSKDYEATTSSSEAWIWIAMARLLLNRLLSI